MTDTSIEDFVKSLDKIQPKIKNEKCAYKRAVIRMALEKYMEHENNN